MSNAVYGTFIPVYLDNEGFNSFEVGTILSLGSVIAILAQPVWGIASDRAKSKNTMLQLMIIGSAVAIIFYPISKNYFFIIAIFSVFTFFKISIIPLSDTITLEYLDSSSFKYGPIRMAGTISYSCMAVLAGFLMKDNIRMIFPLYFLICVGAFFNNLFLPKVKGHQTKENKVSFMYLFKNRMFVLMIIFNLIIMTSLNYYNTFFPIYIKRLGADNTLLGLSMFVAAMSEIPFLMFADRIVRKLGFCFSMILGGVAISIRWLLFSVVNNIFAVILVNSLHGATFIVFVFCMATYINKHVPRELKGSGQSLNGLVVFTLSRLGSVIGGGLSYKYGIQKTFFLSFLFTFSAVIVFSIVFKKLNNLKDKGSIQV